MKCEETDIFCYKIEKHAKNDFDGMGRGGGADYMQMSLVSFFPAGERTAATEPFIEIFISSE